MSAIIAKLQQRLAGNAEKVLFEENGRTLTAIELDRLSDHCAACLQNLGVSAGDNVAVLLPRGLDAVVAIYSILKLDACYVPVDMKSPKDRQAFIIRDSLCKCVLAKGGCPAWLADSGTPYVNIEESTNANNPLSPGCTGSPAR